MYPVTYYDKNMDSSLATYYKQHEETITYYCGLTPVCVGNETQLRNKVSQYAYCDMSKGMKESGMQLVS